MARHLLLRRFSEGVTIKLETVIRPVSASHVTFAPQRASRRYPRSQAAARRARRAPGSRLPRLGAPPARGYGWGSRLRPSWRGWRTGSARAHVCLGGEPPPPASRGPGCRRTQAASSAPQQATPAPRGRAAVRAQGPARARRTRARCGQASATTTLPRQPPR